MFFMFAFAFINFLAASVIINIRKMAGQFSKGGNKKQTKEWTDIILSMYDSNKFYTLAGLLIFINICLYPIMFIKLINNSLLIKNFYAGSILVDLLIDGFIFLVAAIVFLKKRFIIPQFLIFILTVIDAIITIIGRLMPNNSNYINQWWYIQLSGWLVILPLLIILLNIINGWFIRNSIKSLNVKLFNRKKSLTKNTNDDALKYVFGIDLLAKSKDDSAKDNSVHKYFKDDNDSTNKKTKKRKG